MFQTANALAMYCRRIHMRHPLRVNSSYKFRPQPSMAPTIKQKKSVSLSKEQTNNSTVLWNNKVSQSKKVLSSQVVELIAPAIRSNESMYRPRKLIGRRHISERSDTVPRQFLIHCTSGELNTYKPEDKHQKMAYRQKVQPGPFIPCIPSILHQDQKLPIDQAQYFNVQSISDQKQSLEQTRKKIVRRKIEDRTRVIANNKISRQALEKTKTRQSAKKRKIEMVEEGNEDQEVSSGQEEASRDPLASLLSSCSIKPSKMISKKSLKWAIEEQEQVCFKKKPGLVTFKYLNEETVFKKTGPEEGQAVSQVLMNLLRTYKNLVTEDEYHVLNKLIHDQKISEEQKIKLQSIYLKKKQTNQPLAKSVSKSIPHIRSVESFKIYTNPSKEPGAGPREQVKADHKADSKAEPKAGPRADPQAEFEGSFYNRRRLDLQEAEDISLVRTGTNKSFASRRQAETREPKSKGTLEHLGQQQSQSNDFRSNNTSQSAKLKKKLKVAVSIASLNEKKKKKKIKRFISNFKEESSSQDVSEEQEEQNYQESEEESLSSESQEYNSPKKQIIRKKSLNGRNFDQQDSVIEEQRVRILALLEEQHSLKQEEQLFMNAVEYVQKNPQLYADLIEVIKPMLAAKKEKPKVVSRRLIEEVASIQVKHSLYQRVLNDGYEKLNSFLSTKQLAPSKYGLTFSDYKLKSIENRFKGQINDGMFKSREPQNKYVEVENLENEAVRRQLFRELRLFDYLGRDLTSSSDSLKQLLLAKESSQVTFYQDHRV